MGHRTKVSVTILIQFILSLASFGYSTGSFAHHPHDQIEALAISPLYTQDKTLFIANAGHIFRSVDGGYSWHELVKGLDHLYPIASIGTAGSQQGSLDVYLSTLGNGIYHSKDRGDSWVNISSDISNLDIPLLSVRPDGSLFAIDSVGQLNISHDRGLSWHIASLPDNTTVTTISPAVTGSSDMLVGTVTGEVYLSDDNGGSWRSLGQLPSEDTISVIAFDPADTSATHFFVGTQKNGLFESADNGASFQLLDKGLPGIYITSLAFSPDYKQDRTLYASTWQEAVFISNDAGSSWKKYNQGLTTSKQANTVKYRSPHFRKVVVADSNGQTLFIAGFDGLFKSLDSGHNWEEMETLAVSLIKSLDVSPGETNGTYSVAIGTYGGGAYISHNQGKSWTIGNEGLETTRIGDIKFTPSYLDDDTLFAGALRYMLVSDNKGNSWGKSPLTYTNLRKRIVRKLEDFGLPKQMGKDLLDKRDTKPVYPNSIAISPDYANDKTIFVGTRYHGLYLLNTEQMEFEHVWDEATAAISTISLSPDFANDKMAFLFVRGDNLFKSTDGGFSWRHSSKGLPFKDDHDKLEELYTHKNLEVIFSPHFKEDQTLYAAGPMGIFMSTDKGDSWRTIESTVLGTAPNIQALAVAPGDKDDKMILVSLKGRGLFRSMDSGASFVQIGNTLIDNNQSIELIEFSNNFTQDKAIYAASDQDLFLSSDSGDSWTRISRPVRYEDRRSVIKYTGEWESINNDEFSASSVHYSETPGDKAKLNFAGCGVRWLATRSPEGGTVDVYIDSSLVGSVELYSDTVETMAEVFAKHDLECTAHTISIELSAAESRHPRKGRVVLDAFDILPAE